MRAVQTSGSRPGAAGGRGGEGEYAETLERCDGLIARLRAINEEMRETLERDDQRALGSSGKAVQEGGYRDSRRHTLQRHQEVLMEYEEERRRLTRDAEAALERERLLGGYGVRSSSNGGGDESAEARLIRERARIAGGTSAVEDIIGVAQNTARELFSQRGLLQNAGSKLLTMASRFPVLDNLVMAIKKKKNKDAMVLAAVIAACTTFVLLYYMSK